MPNLDDADGFAARAIRAADLAKLVKDPAIADCNRRMAASYSQLADLRRPQPVQLRIVRDVARFNYGF